MADDSAAREERLRHRLTALRLALELLDRATGLTAGQRRLVRTALDATDDLIGELLTPRPARAAAAGPRALAVRAEGATPRRTTGVAALAGRAARRRRFVSGPAAVVAALMALVLFVLVVVGAALLVQVLWAVLLIGLAVWLVRH